MRYDEDGLHRKAAGAGGRPGSSRWRHLSLAPADPPWPLSGCCKKGAPNRCKHNFPKVLNARQRVICRGNARRFKLSTAGRRNALGTVLNLRQSEWFSGTVRAFAVMLLGNSHTGVNFRVPLCDASHDPIASVPVCCTSCNGSCKLLLDDPPSTLRATCRSRSP